MSWYEIVRGSELYQGDIIRSCPIPTIAELEDAVAKDQQFDVDITLYDVCVMTQTCDLENDKVSEVLLAQVLNWAEAKRAAAAAGDTFSQSSRFRKALVAGSVPSTTLLHKHDPAPVLEWSIIDFHRLFVLPKETVSRVADRAGDRLRLVPPYREHVGQAFARYFMRVGLPHDAVAFVAEG